MKIDRAKLSKALNRIGMFVGKNAISPATSMVHFKNLNNKATVFATDLNSAGRAHFDTEEPGDFEFCVDYQQMMMASRMRGKAIDVTFEEGNALKFSDGRTEFSFESKDKDSLSKMEEATVIPEGKSFKISGKDLKKAVAWGGYARNEKNAQYPFITGVHFMSNGESIDMNSTDRQRIAGWKRGSTVNIDGSQEEMMDGIMSPQNIKSVSLFDDDEEISLYITDTQIILVSDECEAYASKINCEYKDISPFFTVPVKSSYTVKTKDVMESLGIYDDKSNWLKLNFSDGKVKVEALCAGGKVYDEFDCTKVSGDNVNCTFDIKKFKDIFNNVKAEEMTIEFRQLNERTPVMTYQTDDGAYGMLGEFRV